MAFLLFIRHHVDDAGDEFGPADVRRFDASEVRLGRAPECECRVEAADLAPVHARLQACDGDAWQVVATAPAGAAPVEVNHQPVGTTPVRVRSGDEVRIGHWAFRFQRLHPPVRQARRADTVAVLAKGLIALTLAAEVLVVAWLPYRIRRATDLEFHVARSQAVLMLDDLRAELRRLKPVAELDKAARQLLIGELNSAARFIRPHEEDLNREQWRQITQDLEEYERVVSRLRDGSAFLPLPALEVEAAVRRALTPTHKEDPPNP